MTARDDDTISKNDRHYLSAIKHRLEMLYELVEDNPRVREHISDEMDWVEDKLEARNSPDSSAAPVLSKRPVAFRVRDEDGWLLFDNEAIANQYAEEIAAKDGVQGLYVRDGTPITSGQPQASGG